MNILKIRSMQRDEVDWAVEMAAKEGWNPGLHDADSFYAQDPDGFLVGLLDGEPIGCISAIRYEGRFGFIGFYIVKPELRGKGFGMQLWRAAMERLQGHLIGLDGVLAQQDNYRKSGFSFQYSNVRFEYCNQLHGAHTRATIATTNIAAVDLPTIASYEHTMFPARRNAFLQSWLTQPNAVALRAHAHTNLAGYGVLRPCRVGYKIGPLLADDPEIADTLFHALCASVEADAKVYLDVPEVNEQGMALAHRHGMGKVFGTARMYTGPAPALDLHKIFGVTTFELG